MGCIWADPNIERSSTLRRSDSGSIIWPSKPVSVARLLLAIFLWVSPIFSSLGWAKSLVGTTFLRILVFHFSRIRSLYSICKFSTICLGEILITSMSLCYRISIFPASRLISKTIWLATPLMSLTSSFKEPLIRRSENDLTEELTWLRVFLLFLRRGMLVCAFLSLKDSKASSSLTLH